MDRLLATKSEGVGLIVRAVSFQDFQPMWSQITNVTDRQTDGQTDRRHAIPRPRICIKVHCAVITLKISSIAWDRLQNYSCLSHLSVYGRSSQSVLTKLCTAVWNRKVRSSSLGVKIRSLLPLFSSVFHPRNAFQWQSLNSALNFRQNLMKIRPRRSAGKFVNRLTDYVAYI